MNNVLQIIIWLLIFSLIITAVKSIYKGAKDGYQMSKDMLSGMTPEEAMRRDKERREKEKLLEKEKYNSKSYKILHPISTFNRIILEKIKSIIKRDKT